MGSQRKVLIFFAIACFLGQAFSVDLQCFVPGECTDSPHIGGAIVDSKEDCLELCNGTCAWFTYFPKSKYCQLLEGCKTLDAESCPECLSGEGGCQVTQPQCFINGECQGNVINVEQAVASRSQCLLECQSNKECAWFTFFPSSFICILYSDCPTLDESCPDGCVSGETRCEDEYPPDSSWHMIIGGKSAAAYTDSVELYNWETGAQCSLASLPEAFGLHAGAIVDGVPVVCGGTTGTVKSDCYEFDKKIKNWLRLPNLVTALSNTDSVVVPDMGWYIFGGNSLTTSQVLKEIGQPWAVGPVNHESRAVTGHCLVQISPNVTAFFGGSVNGNKIVTLDWSTMAYTVHQPQLLRPRVASTCALIRGTDGFPRVAIIGGASKGMEFWNPIDGTVEPVSDELPAEEGATQGLSHSQMIPIKDGSEFMFYGGFKGSHHKGIWKYIVATNNWTRVGSTLVARGEHIALPVTGIDCTTN